MSEQPLKPCPFCGSNRVSEGLNVGCDDCHAEAVYSGSSGQEGAWNNRPIEDRLRSDLDAAVEALVHLQTWNDDCTPDYIFEVTNKVLTKIRGDK